MRSTGAENRLSRSGVTLGFVVAAGLLLPFADLSVASHDPWAELGRMVGGLLRPDLGAVEDIGRSLALTVAFALAGVAIGAAGGLMLAPFYANRAVRSASIAVRSVHEVFWALILMQVSGISVATGVLAIALPYTGIFAKVFADHLEEADQRPSRSLDGRVDALSRFLYARAPLALKPIAIYSLYRLECGLRSSAVLGFIGLPTLGFQLDSFLRQGIYGGAGAILLLYVAMIATIRLWMRPLLLPVWLLAAGVLLATVPTPPMGDGALWRFLSTALVPAPLRLGDVTDPATWAAFATWSGFLLSDQILPGLAATLVVSQLALVLTGLVAFLGFPLIVPRVAGRAGALAGHLLLVVLRSLPEYLLAYLFLQILGPSMLPAVLALGLHNGAIIGHLLGRQARALSADLRPDAPTGVDLWSHELVPRLYGSFLALCLYRWEIIVRESAIVGLLGVMTLGFFVDSAIGELRLDRAVLLLVAAGLVTAAIDRISRRLRSRLGAGRVRVAPAEEARPLPA